MSGRTVNVGQVRLRKILKKVLLLQPDEALDHRRLRRYLGRAVEELTLCKDHGRPEFRRPEVVARLQHLQHLQTQVETGALQVQDLPTWNLIVHALTTALQVA